MRASPGRDDGTGIDNATDDDTLAELLGGWGSQLIVGGHTHDPTDRTVSGIRALNPGSVGLPRESGHACWALIEADQSRVDVQLRKVGFDIAAVVEDLHRRGYPNAAFLEEVLGGTRRFGP